MAEEASSIAGERSLATCPSLLVRPARRACLSAVVQPPAHPTCSFAFNASAAGRGTMGHARKPPLHPPCRCRGRGASYRVPRSAPPFPSPLPPSPTETGDA
eukprot:366391-Chlamydomonas_euryale.AAC.6